MGVRRYQDLAAWQLARELERGVFAFTAKGSMTKDFEYCRQIRKSSSSAPRNIAEGFGRYYPREFARFTRVALGSLNETKDHLDAGLEQSYLGQALHEELQTLANRAIGASVKLVKYLDSCPGPPGKRTTLRRTTARKTRGTGT
jgi:four helix bundle protein